MGIGRVALVGSYRVEKSYFASPLLAPEAMARELRLGLEQGRDTVAPAVVSRRYFKPFVEDELDALFPSGARLLADPAGSLTLAAIGGRAPRAVLAIGPEGGWTRYEGEMLQQRGFQPFTLGPRVLRVDVAVPFAAAQAQLWVERWLPDGLVHQGTRSGRPQGH
jgi:RsmE family RNA methyltransferase